LQEQFSFLKLSIGAKAIIYPQYQVSEWLLFNAKWLIFQVYHGKNMVQWWDDDIYKFQW
jgi:hypothetical protein